MALKGDPWMALAMACRMAQVEKTEVGRPRQVAMVRGLKRNLWLSVLACRAACLGPYDITTSVLLALRSFLGEVKSLDWLASPDSAILINASALSRSTAM